MSGRLFDASYIIAAKQESAQWAANLLAQAEAATRTPEPEPDGEEAAPGVQFCILDCETTGMGAQAEPVQITLLNWNGVPLLNTLVRPGCKIEYGASQVHGIGWEDVRSAPTFGQVIGTFKAAVGSRIVIAYNLAFDRRIIRQTVEKYRLTPPLAMGYDCAMLRYAAFRGIPKNSSSDFKWHSLSDACAYMGIERTASHGSLVDCQATLQLIQAMALAKYGS